MTVEELDAALARQQAQFRTRLEAMLAVPALKTLTADQRELIRNLASACYALGANDGHETTATLLKSTFPAA